MRSLLEISSRNAYQRYIEALGRLSATLERIESTIRMTNEQRRRLTYNAHYDFVLCSYALCSRDHLAPLSHFMAEVGHRRELERHLETPRMTAIIEHGFRAINDGWRQFRDVRRRIDHVREMSEKVMQRSNR